MSLSKKLDTWFEDYGRTLPWRGIDDPYRIWLSEIILQQTRIEQGRDYYHRFVEAFPTVADLAAASPAPARTRLASSVPELRHLLRQLSPHAT